MEKEHRHPGTVAVNRRAHHDYHIEESYEAGLTLTGSEIKSVRAGRVNLRGSYARVTSNEEVFLYDTHISPYAQSGTYFNHDPVRPRKLLLHKREIKRLGGLVQQKGLTLVPLRIYLKGRRAKLELGVARGKKLYDKREDIAKRDAQRDIERAMKSRRRDTRDE
ncbi:MAG: SsrA-binding protein SmpB [Chloroflexaceae bacterium]|nr:SsrA-binding protein SmpB [Chloroflexaceae bacterium]